ncbi:MAG: FixH family protein [Pyrinomonadaceae bacterium]|nr:FixH family protein [Pyrinomonadaceae bacterium]
MMLMAFALAVISLGACGAEPKAKDEPEEEALARTEFTNRIENFFEYDPLKAGKQSQFLIHLTDLSDGTPVEKAEVTLSVRAKGGVEVAQIKARIGKVTGIYVADVNIPSAGDYDIEFHIRNEKLDERMALTDFKVE